MREYNFYVYMLRCSDGSYYTGVTNDYHRRLAQHNAGTDPRSYTFKRRPLELVHVMHFENIHEAITREKQLKRWSRKKKEALIEGNENLLHIFAACQNESHFLNRKSSADKE